VRADPQSPSFTASLDAMTALRRRSAVAHHIPSYTPVGEEPLDPFQFHLLLLKNGTVPARKTFGDGIAMINAIWRCDWDFCTGRCVWQLIRSLGVRNY
jgi:hypothetical protein